MGRRSSAARRRAEAQPKLDAYQRRNNTLRSMGFLTYSEYLDSDLWKSIRSRFLFKNRRCCACDRVATQVHHTNYERPVLDGSDSSALRPVCGDCHQRAEFGDEDGKKLNLAAANRKLASMAGETPAAPSSPSRNGIAQPPRRRHRRPTLPGDDRPPESVVNPPPPRKPKNPRVDVAVLLDDLERIAATLAFSAMDPAVSDALTMISEMGERLRKLAEPIPPPPSVVKAEERKKEAMEFRPLNVRVGVKVESW